MTVRAMILERPREPLRAAQLELGDPGPGQVRLSVRACGICRTDLHIVDGELADAKLPLVLGHQVVASVERVGPGVERLSEGDRVGVPWLGWVDGTCRYCRSGRENLCEAARFTGYHLDGGYADGMVADARVCLPIPDEYDDLEAAPLLCAGLIGYRSLRLTGDAERLGLYGFGNAARIVAQVAVHEGRRVFAFTRTGDAATQRKARELGCAWAGDSTEPPPEPLDGAILFAAVGELVPVALAAVAPGGVVVCAEIHMSDIPSFEYRLLWGERVLRSVANLTVGDGVEFLRLAPTVPVRTEVRTFSLTDANDALDAARAGGASVILVP